MAGNLDAGIADVALFCASREIVRALRRGKMTVRTVFVLVATALMLSSACFSQAKSATQEEPVFRAPIKLKLHVDDARYYEQSFDRIPHVADNDVYLFAGEVFGVNVKAAESDISHVAYEPSLAKADVELRFTQKKSQGWMMMLVIRNKLKHRLWTASFAARRSTTGSVV